MPISDFLSLDDQEQVTEMLSEEELISKYLNLDEYDEDKEDEVEEEEEEPEELATKKEVMWMMEKK